jgi:ABC-2 type transport system permease protein
MKARPRFSFARLRGIIAKEFTQMRRDRLTFAMMLGIPLLQLTLFGYAINSDPRHLPAAVLLADSGPQGRTILHAMKNSTFFDFVRQVRTEREGTTCSRKAGCSSSSIFRKTSRATCCAAIGHRCLSKRTRPIPRRPGSRSARSARNSALALHNDLKGPLEFLNVPPGPIDLRVHALYNPESNTQFNIVPGLMGVILTMTMIMITGLAITRERERGTMENLLSMPTLPSEVLIGKIVPTFLIGYVQVGVILIAAHFLFHVPMHGSIALLPRGRARLHRRESRHGHHLLNDRKESTPGDADDLLRLPAVDPALRLHVPISGHAALGAGDWRGLPANPFSPHRSRHSAQGKRN